MYTAAMIPEVRAKFNAGFNQQRYEQFNHAINTEQAYPADFKVCETPLFLSTALRDQLLSASNAVVNAIQSDEYKARTKYAIPGGYGVGWHPLITSSQSVNVVKKSLAGALVRILVSMAWAPKFTGCKRNWEI